MMEVVCLNCGSALEIPAWCAPSQCKVYARGEGWYADEVTILCRECKGQRVNTPELKGSLKAIRDKGAIAQYLEANGGEISSLEAAYIIAGMSDGDEFPDSEVRELYRTRAYRALKSLEELDLLVNQMGDRNGGFPAMKWRLAE